MFSSSLPGRRDGERSRRERREEGQGDGNGSKGRGGHYGMERERERERECYYATGLHRGDGGTKEARNAYNSRRWPSVRPERRPSVHQYTWMFC